MLLGLGTKPSRLLLKVLRKHQTELFDKYSLLAKDNTIEFTDSQVKLINEFDKLKHKLESNIQTYDRLKQEMINFSDKPKVEVKPTQLNFFQKLFSSGNKEVHKDDKNKLKSMDEFEQYEEMLGSYSSLNDIKGLYIYGSPGSGKTFLMDFFYDNTNFPYKKRTHFNAFMLEVHNELHKLRSATTYKNVNIDPLYILATEMAKKSFLICFDEFQVTDIADAVILKRLFHVLYKNHVTIVATSNRHPDKLYLNGLQRHLFLPFISELKIKNKILHISAKDFRIRHDIISEKFLSPITEENLIKFERMFLSLTSNHKGHVKEIEVMNGRKIICDQYYKGVGMFSFDELCDRPVGSADYIAISQTCSTVLLKNVPYFSVNNRNVLRRFITLIDEFYNHNVKVYLIAVDNVDKLFVKEEGTEEHYDEVFAFERCLSRMKEMQTEYYFKKNHQFYGSENN